MACGLQMTILIATNNPAKAREIAAVLSANDAAGDSVTWKSLSDLGEAIPEPVEDRDSFLENATLKATYYSKATGLWALADDSGLEVDALGGEPGVHSAYFDRNSAHLPRAQRDGANNAKLAAMLLGRETRSARYRCVLVLAAGDCVLAMSEGIFEGVIVDEPRGRGGFGYDPYFLVPALGKTVAELSPEEKNRISHRGKALAALREQLRTLSPRA